MLKGAVYMQNWTSEGVSDTSSHKESRRYWAPRQVPEAIREILGEKVQEATERRDDSGICWVNTGRSGRSFSLHPWAVFSEAFYLLQGQGTKTRFTHSLTFYVALKGSPIFLLCLPRGFYTVRREPVDCMFQLSHRTLLWDWHGPMGFQLNQKESAGRDASVGRTT